MCFGKRITGIYISHGHSDHWIGLARLQEHFPDARGIASPDVVERARFEATDPGLSGYWQNSFPGELPATPHLPEALPGDEFELEGQVLRTGVATSPTIRSDVIAVARNEKDRKLAAAHLTGGDPYSFTAPMLAWAAARAAAGGVQPAGALGPVEAFGAGDLETGCASAGFHRQRTGSG